MADHVLKITLQTASRPRLSLALAEQELTLSTSLSKPQSPRRISCFCPLSEDHEVNHAIPYRQVVDATFDPSDNSVEVAYLNRSKKTKGYRLFRYRGSVDAGQEESASQWTERLMHSAYEGLGIKRFRRLRVLVNPYGGKGNGASIYSKTVGPIFRAARCVLHVTETTHSGHACEIAKGLLVDDYDVLVTVSGDGLIHEVMNGFADNANPQHAFSLPIAPIPTGSGNGLSLNLLGPQDGFDVVAAALNIIKGLPMRVDAFSVVQNGKRSISFMSQALGLMADLDIGTEHLRWMGDLRFMLGFLYGLVLYKPCPVRLSYKEVETDKAKMVDDLKARRANIREQYATKPGVTALNYDPDGKLPPLKHSTDEEGWTTFEEPLLYVYAGKGPYVGRDYMAFPVSLPDDGLIDIVAMGRAKRTDMVRTIATAADGEAFWLPKLHYIKAHAYRIQPLKKHGNLSIDGEAMPFEDFQVEVHNKLATVLSLHGHYVADFPRGDGVGILSRRNSADMPLLPL